MCLLGHHRLVSVRSLERCVCARSPSSGLCEKSGEVCALGHHPLVSHRESLYGNCTLVFFSLITDGQFSLVCQLGVTLI